MAGILRGMYRLQPFDSQDQTTNKKRVRLLGSGTILREVRAAAEMLADQFGISAEVWSVTSFNELARDMHDVERHNMLNPEAEPQISYVQQCLPGQVPVIAATDYIRSYADQIRNHIGADYRVLGTDGFGRSDTRAKLRRFFEVDRAFVVLAAMKSLAEAQVISQQAVAKARDTLGIDASKANPRLV
jgi:pyruvate dehydrogenase E1 component